MRASGFGWTLHREKSIYAMPGERAFRKDVGPGLALWCMVVPSQKMESFTVEIGWSRLERYPQLSVRPSPGSHEHAHGREECVVRLGEVAFGTDHWWEIEPVLIPRDADDLMRMIAPVPAEVARSRVVPLIEEALALLERSGEPYLRAIGVA